MQIILVDSQAQIIPAHIKRRNIPRYTYLDTYISCMNSLLQDHIAQCRKFPVSCPNHCGISIPRDMVRFSILSCSDLSYNLGLQFKLVISIIRQTSLLPHQLPLSLFSPFPSAWLRGKLVMKPGKLQSSK